jgi:hypothetical protein
MVENILILKNVVIIIFFALFETKAQLTNIPANYERDWGHQITIEKMSDVLDLVQVHRVLVSPLQYLNTTVTFQAYLPNISAHRIGQGPLASLPTFDSPNRFQVALCDLLRQPRPEAELYWYAEVGAACNGAAARLPRPPEQQAALFRADGGIFVSRTGTVRTLAGRLLLDPTAHGACHRMLPAEDDPPPLSALPSGLTFDYDELFVISQVLSTPLHKVEHL